MGARGRPCARSVPPRGAAPTCISPDDERSPLLAEWPDGGGEPMRAFGYAKRRYTAGSGSSIRRLLRKRCFDVDSTRTPRGPRPFRTMTPAIVAAMVVAADSLLSTRSGDRVITACRLMQRTHCRFFADAALWKRILAPGLARLVTAPHSTSSGRVPINVSQRPIADWQSPSRLRSMHDSRPARQRNAREECAKSRVEHQPQSSQHARLPAWPPQHGRDGRCRANLNFGYHLKAIALVERDVQRF
jgi:hypothetical protein